MLAAVGEQSTALLDPAILLVEAKGLVVATFLAVVTSVLASVFGTVGKLSKQIDELRDKLDCLLGRFEALPNKFDASAVNVSDSRGVCWPALTGFAPSPISGESPHVLVQHGEPHLGGLVAGVRLRLLRDYITEAMCKNLTLRVKRTGMKWDPDNAAAVTNLVALRESGQWNVWWTPSAA